MTADFRSPQSSPFCRTVAKVALDCHMGLSPAITLPHSDCMHWMKVKITPWGRPLNSMGYYFWKMLEVTSNSRYKKQANFPSCKRCSISHSSVSHCLTNINYPTVGTLKWQWPTWPASFLFSYLLYFCCFVWLWFTDSWDRVRLHSLGSHWNSYALAS